MKNVFHLGKCTKHLLSFLSTTNPQTFTSTPLKYSCQNTGTACLKVHGTTTNTNTNAKSS